MRSRVKPPLLLLVLLGGCESPTRPPEAIEGPDEVPVQTLYGDVVLTRVPGTGNVMIALDGGPTPNRSDGTADFVFILQRDGFAEPVLFRRLSGAKVTYTRDGAVLSAPGGFSAGLFLGSSVAEARLLRGKGMPGETWVGYGLSRRTGTWPIPRANEEKQIVSLASCNGQVGAPGTPRLSLSACDSGGPGSTQCSTPCTRGGDCSTTCMAGFHSCCDMAACSCTCVRIVVPG